MINWDNFHNNSGSFKKSKPFKFGFVEEFFKRDFYDKLYETYPKIDDKWKISNDLSKYQYSTIWHPNPESEKLEIMEGEDPQVGPEWKNLMEYAISEEFLEHFRKYSEVKVTKCKFFGFIGYKKGGFQLPHIHNEGPSTLVVMLYFSKGWQKGDPGGTYMASDLDESSIIFEPYNLDNSIALFHDGPKAAHGVRYITKDVTRRAFQITLEGYSSSDGWSGGHGYENLLKSVQSDKK